MIRVNFESAQEVSSAKLESLKIEALTHVFNNPEWFYNFHSHDISSEIIYIENGHGIYTLNNVSYSASAGNLIIINAKVLHNLTSDAHEALNAWTLTLSDFSIPGLEPNQVIHPSSCPIIRLGENEEFFRQGFVHILAQRRAQNTHYNEIAHSIAAALLLSANQLADAVERAEPKRGTSDILRRNVFAAEVIAYMDRHFQEPISLEMLSDKFHVSAGHISHMLTNEFGISPINYLISRRIGEAQWLLLTTELSVHDIASHVGYDNAYHFSKLFEKRIGMRPQDFRFKFKNQGEKVFP